MYELPRGWCSSRNNVIGMCYSDLRLYRVELVQVALLSNNWHFSILLLLLIQKPYGIRLAMHD